MNKIVIDLDGTLTIDDPAKSYEERLPRLDVIQKLQAYRELGFQISVFTARNMRTHKGNLGLINIHTLPIIVEWLNRHQVPYDEVIVGKPWCGTHGFYVDDRALRPEEFVELSPQDIAAKFQAALN